MKTYLFQRLYRMIATEFTPVGPWTVEAQSYADDPDTTPTLAAGQTLFLSPGSFEVRTVRTEYDILS